MIPNKENLEQIPPVHTTKYIPDIFLQKNASKCLPHSFMTLSTTVSSTNDITLNTTVHTSEKCILKLHPANLLESFSLGFLKQNSGE